MFLLYRGWYDMFESCRRSEDWLSDTFECYSTDQRMKRMKRTVNKCSDFWKERSQDSEVKEKIHFFFIFFLSQNCKKKKVRFDSFSVRIMRKLSEMLNEIKCHYCNKKITSYKSQNLKKTHKNTGVVKKQWKSYLWKNYKSQNCKKLSLNCKKKLKVSILEILKKS